MPIRVACPSCKSVINAPDAAAGKTVKCPKCKTAMELPAAEPEFDVVEDNEFEVVEEPAPKRKQPVREEAADRTRPKKPRRDEDEDDRPRRTQRRDEDDEEEEQPRRSRRRDEDDDDDDDRPRRKKKLPMAALIGGGVGLLLVLVVVGLWAGGVFKGGGNNVGGGPGGGRTPPPGWSLANGTKFTAFLRGGTSKMNFNNGSTTNATQYGKGYYEAWVSHIDKETYQVECLAYENYKPAAGAEALFAEFQALSMMGGFSPWDTLDSKTMSTVNGHPCLDIRWHYNDNWQDENHDQPGQPAKLPGTGRIEEHAARVVIVGEKVIVMKIDAGNSKLNDENVKTFFDSLIVQ